MNHKHLNAYELFETSLIDGTRQSEKIENCDLCRTRLQKTAILLSKLREKEIAAGTGIYNNIRSRDQITDDSPGENFLSFVSGSIGLLAIEFQEASVGTFSARTCVPFR